MLDQPLDSNAARWKPYMSSGPQPGGLEGARLASDDWMLENMPDLTEPWHAAEHEELSEKQKGFWLFSPEGRSRVLHKMQVSNFLATERLRSLGTYRE